MANGILVREPDCYKKGDTIVLTSSDYLYGLYYANGLVVNLPLNKPVRAGGFTVTFNSNQYTYASIAGSKDITGPSAHAKAIANTTLQFNIQGTYTNPPTALTPVIIALDGAVITFT